MKRKIFIVLAVALLLCCSAALSFAAPFTDNGNGTVTDIKTGLVWQQGEPGYKTWGSALSYCEGLDLGNKTDWRLPNIKELESITDDTRYNPAIDTNYFPNAHAYYYWSSTTVANSPYYAWNVYFVDGCVNYYYKDYNFYVRCVRGGQSGSFGNLDHFDFSFISSPKSVGAPFSVTITAKDVYGYTENYNGYVSLYSNAGSVNPITAWLNNGTWTGNVTLYEGGTFIFLGANAGGKYGTSNTFDVTGGVSNTGNLGGTVRDNRRAPLSGASVYLDNNKDGISDYSQTTDSNGYYRFTNIPAGYYDIWADYESSSNKNDGNYVFVVADRLVTENLVITKFYSGKTPVILVPGIAGTKYKHTSSDQIIPELPGEYPAKASQLVLHDPRIPPFSPHPGWQTLITELENKCYEREETIIGGGYDWRMPVKDVVDQYLIPAINKAKDITGSPKVNIVAHSTGGLVVRSYIQSDEYLSRNDIDKFAMVATPNLGAVNAYYIWEGGDPKWADDLNGGIINFYWQLTKKMHEKTYKLGDLDSDDHLIIRNFIHDKVPELRDLMPTFNDFLEYKGSFSGIESDGNKNKTVISLNDNPNRKTRMSPTGGTDVVKTKVFYSESEDTIESHSILNPYIPRRTYEDGVPQLYKNPVKTAGDKTVLKKSSKFPCDANEGWAGCSPTRESEHGDIIHEYADLIRAFIDEGEPQCTSQSAVSGRLFASETVTKVLSLSVNGRVQPYISNPDGQGSGAHYVSLELANDIPGANVNIGADAGSVSIENPMDGVYTIYLRGAYDDDYNLTVEYTDSEKIVTKEYHGFNHANTTSFTITVNSGSSDKITINHTPLPPSELQADAMDSGGLKTQLTWTASTSPDVDHYNIYSKYNDAPYLAQIGSSTSNSFNTGHPWAEDSSVATSLYAVSAVKADGKESFLSDMAKNNDRDHDGLTDEEEVTYGTDVSNPDSDGDGLKDGEEYMKGTDPLLTDTDSDGYSDYEEVQLGSDPLDADSVPCTDMDDDGYAVEGGICGPVDCDDINPYINPGASEGPYGDATCSDTFDNDCDGFVDSADSGCQAPVVDVTGCIDLGGSPLVNKKVILKQTGEVNQTATTDSGGCYVFLNAVSGKAFTVQISGPVLSSPAPVINGCTELQGSAMTDRKVLLKQKNETNKSTKTDIEGCYSFSNAVPDKKFKLLIKGPVVP
ncbi:MAG: DUF1566 domain-containing protein [Nitrospiraceae bacterium]|nr:MAG: DUF1566 domain-containing protein [Nitrospiraceae bacterium]